MLKTIKVVNVSQTVKLTFSECLLSVIIKDKYLSSNGNQYTKLFYVCETTKYFVYSIVSVLMSYGETDTHCYVYKNSTSNIEQT